MSEDRDNSEAPRQRPSLLPATEALLPHIMEWFPSETSCREWGGPHLRFPFTQSTFRDDIQLDRVASYVLGTENTPLLAFGQYYPRLGRCHLARLAVAPAHRGRRVGETLIAELARLGCAALCVDECSLFVLPSNERALHLYRRLGFVERPYSGDGLPGSSYMVASLDDIYRKVGSR